MSSSNCHVDKNDAGDGIFAAPPQKMARTGEGDNGNIDGSKNIIYVSRAIMNDPVATASLRRLNPHMQVVVASEETATASTAVAEDAEARSEVGTRNASEADAGGGSSGSDEDKDNGDSCGLNLSPEDIQNKSWTASLIVNGHYCLDIDPVPSPSSKEYDKEHDVFACLDKDKIGYYIRFDPDAYPVNKSGDEKLTDADDIRSFRLAQRKSLQENLMRACTDQKVGYELRIGSSPGNRQNCSYMQCSRGRFYKAKNNSTVKGNKRGKISRPVKEDGDVACPLKFTIGYDDHSFFIRCGFGRSKHEGHLPHHAEEIQNESWTASLMINGHYCLDIDPVPAPGASEYDGEHDLFSYVGVDNKQHYIRFDPGIYPVNLSDEDQLTSPDKIEDVVKVTRRKLQDDLMSACTQQNNGYQLRVGGGKAPCFTMRCFRGTFSEAKSKITARKYNIKKRDGKQQHPENADATLPVEEDGEIRCPVRFTVGFDQHSYFIRCGHGVNRHEGHESWVKSDMSSTVASLSD